MAESHDHAACVAQALAAAETVCRRRGARLTDLRLRVLELVWASHNPIGAYEILDRLRADGRSAAPPTVYRALEFLLAHGLIHKIESRNAFIGCADPRHTHDGQFMICADCGIAAEVHDTAIDGAIKDRAAKLGFSIDRPVVEIVGHCANCRDRAQHG